MAKRNCQIICVDASLRRQSDETTKQKNMNRNVCTIQIYFFGKMSGRTEIMWNKVQWMENEARIDDMMIDDTIFSAINFTFGQSHIVWFSIYFVDANFQN